MPDNLTINVNQTLNELIPIFLNATNITINSKVVDAVKHPRGKWSQYLGNVITFDSKYIFETIVSSVLTNLDKDLKNLTSDITRVILELALNTDLRNVIVNIR